MSGDWEPSFPSGYPCQLLPEGDNQEEEDYENTCKSMDSFAGLHFIQVSCRVCRVPPRGTSYGHTANSRKLGPVLVSFCTSKQTIFPSDEELL